MPFAEKASRKMMASASGRRKRTLEDRRDQVTYFEWNFRAIPSVPFELPLLELKINPEPHLVTQEINLNSVQNNTRG